MADGVLRQLLAVFSFGVDVKELKKGERELHSFYDGFKKVAAGFAGGVIAHGIKNFVKETVDEMMQIRRGAQELRITTDEMQALRSAARATGMDVKYLHFVLERIQVNVERSTRDGHRQAEAMRLFGISAHDSAGKAKSATELFLELASGMEKVKDQNKQALGLWDLAGRGAHRLLPLLRLGRERIEELMRVTEVYGKYQAETIEKAGQFSFALEIMRARLTGVKDFIMSQWLPMFEEGLKYMGKWIDWAMKMAKHSLLAKAALQVLSAAMVALGLRLMFAYPWVALITAALTALTLIWDDILVLFDGGHSLIGDAIDAVFGKGQSTALIVELKKEWQSLWDLIQKIGKFLGLIDEPDPVTPDGPMTAEEFKRTGGRRGFKAYADEDAYLDANLTGPANSLERLLNPYGNSVVGRLGRGMFGSKARRFLFGGGTPGSAVPPSGVPSLYTGGIGPMTAEDNARTGGWGKGNDTGAAAPPVTIGAIHVYAATGAPEHTEAAIKRAVKDAHASLRREKQR